MAQLLRRDPDDRVVLPELLDDEDEDELLTVDPELLVDDDDPLRTVEPLLLLGELLEAADFTTDFMAGTTRFEVVVRFDCVASRTDL